MTPRLPCIARRCTRRAVALVTDMEHRNPEGYAPVCISHVMTAASNGLARARRETPGYRRPFMLIPLDSDYVEETARRLCPWLLARGHDEATCPECRAIREAAR